MPCEIPRLWRGDRFFKLESLGFRACFCVVQSNMSFAQIYIYIYIYICICLFVDCNTLTGVTRRMTYSIRGHSKQRYENLYTLSLVVLGTSKLHKNINVFVACHIWIYASVYITEFHIY